MIHATNKGPATLAAAVTTTLATVLALGVTAARADEQLINLKTFEEVTPYVGAPNVGALGVAGVNFFSYSGTGAAGTFFRTEGVDTDGNGGGNALFQRYDSSGSAPAFFFFAGLGSFYFVDGAIGLPANTPDKLRLTFDIKAQGLVPGSEPPQTQITFTQQSGLGGSEFRAILPLAISDTYSTVGGTLDTFFAQDTDPDGAGPLPVGPSVFTGRNSFQFQLDFGAGPFGYDNDNKISIDNVRVSVIRPVYRGGEVSSYNDAANWSEGQVPNGTSAFPQFGPNAGVARTVTLDTAVTVNRLDFAGAIADAVTLSGTGSLRFEGNSPGLIDHSGIDSVQTLNVPVILAKSGTIRVNAGGSLLDLAGGVSGTGTIRKDRNGSMRARNIRLNGGLNIVGGRVELQAGQGDAGTSSVTALTVSATEASANLRLNDSRLIVDYTGASPLAATVASVVAGDITGTATTPANQAVAVVERSQLPTAFGATFGGQPTDATSLLLILTLRGDANLDRAVNFPDLVTLAQNYNVATGAGWEDGDFDYSGGVGFPDLVSLAQNYNGSFSADAIDGLGADFAGDFRLALSLVPEPTTLAAVAGLTSVALRRRRQR